MFSHVFLGTENIERAKSFYDSIMTVLGYGEGSVDPKGRCIYVSKTGVLGLTKPIDGQPATHGNGMTVGFLASSPEAVDEWHRIGVENGGTSIEGGPGMRGTDERRLYMAYLRDPDGNKICATHFMQ
ncbi:MULTISPECIES: VOC family protein [Vibrio]|uniref:VOC family protein n=1 Tax=Vibrio TaxID=662 RepID=UPI000C84E954|nr:MULTISPECIES: VOC family protein [Vibrio]PMG38963.1 glyoxalase [Vibrio splendidus]PMK14394.1 glyoxalase [Vibrio splendidus]UQV22507.1 VOC family protein [Vibrio sp. J383]